MGRVFGFIFFATGILGLVLSFVALVYYVDLPYGASEFQESLHLILFGAYISGSLTAFFFSYVAFSVDRLLEDNLLIKKFRENTYLKGDFGGDTYASDQGVESKEAELEPRVIKLPNGRYKITPYITGLTFLSEKEAQEFLDVGAKAQ